MLTRDLLILVGLGGLFVLLGLVSVLFGISEEKGYYNAISTKWDVREFLERWPRRPEPEALRIGGWIAISVGLIMVAIGAGFWLLG